MSQTACSVQEVITFPEYITGFLSCDNEKENGANTSYCPIGGISSDCSFSWLANKAKFEVVQNNQNRFGLKIAAWTFGAMVKDPSTEVVCCIELPKDNGRVSLLLVGLNCELTGGMVCVFNMGGSKVFRAIEIGQQITSMHLVDASLNASSLFGPLQIFDGVLAVGTANGSLLLIDICRQICDELFCGRARDFEEIRDEVRYCNLEIITYIDPSSLESYKVQALNDGKHLAIQLNYDATSGPHFLLMGPKGDTKVTVNKEEVTISSLHYCPQLSSILVGFNFGAFQLWNLITLKLEYTSPVFEENVPVSHFALQEPSDDPKAYAYIWVVYSYMEYIPDNFPIAVLYSLVYETKEWHEDSGYFYEDFRSCSFRYQMELTPSPGCDLSSPRGARCLSVRSITKAPNRGVDARQDLPDYSVAVCAIAWTVYSSHRPHSHTYISLFDLNQWYKEQMPSTMEGGERYLTRMCISELLQDENRSLDDTTATSDVLDVSIDPKTVRLFMGAQRLEEHYYPSSLAFRCCVLRSRDFAWIESLGVQRALLSQLDRGGPLTLLRPSEVYDQCIATGLLPLFTDASSHGSDSLPLHEQRELLLNVALEQQRVVWLCKCAKAWSDGSYSSMGCSLEFMLQWAWQRAAVLKSNTDTLCIPLFDYSGTKLDYNSSSLLNNCTRQLRHLHTLFGSVLRDCTAFLVDPDVTEQRYESLGLVSSYLDVLRWLINVGLLPECPIATYPRLDDHERLCAPYPAESLALFYNSRRVKLNSLLGARESSHHHEKNVTTSSLLFIDNLILHECGDEQLHRQWQLDGGSGLYPPPSLQALLRIYLLEGIPVVNKHKVLIYFFLDLAMALNDQAPYRSINTNLIKFPAVFQVSPSIIKLMQAFWQLDHGDFDTAMQQLLDPLVKKQDLKMWHHRTIIEAMVKQNQFKHALIYLQVIQPPLHEFSDICITITLYLANNMLHEGFNYLRQHRTANNEVQLLEHFFHECKKTNNLSAINSFLLSPLEEATFMKFLESCDDEENRSLQVGYYIQRSRFVEAHEANEQLKVQQSQKQGLIGKGQQLFRDLLIEDYYNSMPDVSKDLLQHYKNQSTRVWKEVSRPEPLSVFVHSARPESVRYKSSLIEAAMMKAKETWTQPSLQSFLTEHGFSPRRCGTEEIPFLRTPTASAKRLMGTSSGIYPTIINPEEDEESPPTKRFKISARQSLIPTRESLGDSPSNLSRHTPSRLSLSQLNVSTFNTPIVKRRLSSANSSLSTTAERMSMIGTPQSILKVRSLVQTYGSVGSRGNTPTPERLDEISEKEDETEGVRENIPTSFTVTPRKYLVGHTPHIVRFQGISRNSSLSSAGTLDSPNEPRQSFQYSKMESTKIADDSRKDSTTSTVSDVFYSPDVSSINVSDTSAGNVTRNSSEIITETNNVATVATAVSKNEKEKSPVTPFEISALEESSRDSLRTPKCRKTYKDLRESSPIRSSPRLSARLSLPKEVVVANQQPVSTRKGKKSSIEIEVETENMAAITPKSIREIETTIESPVQVTTLEKSTNEEKIQDNVHELSYEADDSFLSTPKSVLNFTSSIDSSLSLSDAKTPKSESKFPKIRGRKSLSRQVLEQNAFNRAMERTPSLLLEIKSPYQEQEAKAEKSEPLAQDSSTVENAYTHKETDENVDDRRTPSPESEFHTDDSFLKTPKSILSSFISTDASPDTSPWPSDAPKFPKVTARKSLSRKSLQTGSVIGNALFSPIGESKSPLQKESTYSKTKTCSLAKSEDGEIIEESRVVSNVKVTDSFKSAQDPNSCKQTVTQQHQEKSTVSIVTKIVVDGVEVEPSPGVEADVSASGGLEESGAFSEEKEKEMRLNVAVGSNEIREALDASSNVSASVINILDSSNDSDLEEEVVQVQEGQQEENKSVYQTLEGRNYADNMNNACGSNEQYSSERANTSSVQVLENNVFEITGNSSPTSGMQEENVTLGFAELENARFDSFSDVSDSYSDTSVQEVNTFERNVFCSDSEPASRESSSNDAANNARSADEDAHVDVEVYERILAPAPEENFQDDYIANNQGRRGINGHVSDEERVESDDERELEEEAEEEEDDEEARISPDAEYHEEVFHLDADEHNDDSDQNVWPTPRNQQNDVEEIIDLDANEDDNQHESVASSGSRGSGSSPNKRSVSSQESLSDANNESSSSQETEDSSSKSSEDDRLTIDEEEANHSNVINKLPVILEEDSDDSNSKLATEKQSPMPVHESPESPGSNQLTPQEGEQLAPVCIDEEKANKSSKESNLTTNLQEENLVDNTSPRKESDHEVEETFCLVLEKDEAEEEVAKKIKTSSPEAHTGENIVEAPTEDEPGPSYTTCFLEKTNYEFLNEESSNNSTSSSLDHKPLKIDTTDFLEKAEHDSIYIDSYEHNSSSSNIEPLENHRSLADYRKPNADDKKITESVSEEVEKKRTRRRSSVEPTERRLLRSSSVGIEVSESPASKQESKQESTERGPPPKRRNVRVASADGMSERYNLARSGSLEPELMPLTESRKQTKGRSTRSGSIDSQKEPAKKRTPLPRGRSNSQSVVSESDIAESSKIEGDLETKREKVAKRNTQQKETNVKSNDDIDETAAQETSSLNKGKTSMQKMNTTAADVELESAPSKLQGTVRRRTRSESDNVEVPSKRCLRSNSSVCEEDTTEQSKPVKKPLQRSKRTSSVSSALPTINEEIPTKTETSSVKKPKKAASEGQGSLSSAKMRASKMEAYSTARRLTRRQKMMMEQTMGNVPEEKTSMSNTGSEIEVDNLHRGPDLDEIDPLKLLHKEPFQGKPDPEELKMLLASPASSSGSTESSITTRSATKAARNTRSGSEVSHGSSDAGSPPKRSRRKIDLDTIAVGKATDTKASSEKGSLIGKRATRKRSNTLDSDKSDSSRISTRSKTSVSSASKGVHKLVNPVVLLESISEELASTSSKSKSSRGRSRRSATSSPERTKK